MTPEYREWLGRRVREEWEKWAREQPDVAEHPSWTRSWPELDEREREVDRVIGEALYDIGFFSAAERARAALRRLNP